MKKTIIKHKFETKLSGSVYTACGRYLPRYASTTIRGNKTWKGVTCQKCLGVKAKADRVKAAIKSNRKRIGATV